jgi:hypothetical protein
MLPPQILHTLFVLFHIESSDKSAFAYELNSQFIQHFENIEELSKDPDQMNVFEEEEEKQASSFFSSSCYLAGALEC